MIAVLIATGQNAAFHGLDESMPIPLIPLADRPFIQHIVEYLVRQGVRRFEIILSHLPEKIEHVLGDGARWGCSFRYHLATSEGDAFRLARTIAGANGDETMLGSGTCLPAFELSALEPDTILCRNGIWTGWGRFSPGAALSSSLEANVDVSSLRDTIRQYPADVCLSIDDGEEFLASQRAVLSGTFAGLLIAARESEPGIWISRNVVLHPSVILERPVYIGENCRIGRGARIGPSAVIGANCIIDAHSTVVNSAVSPGTYVGEGLELDSVIVNRNRLVNVRLGTSFLASDTFLLGSLTLRSSRRRLQRLRDRMIALAFLLVLWPLLLLSWVYFLVTGRGRLNSRQIVSIPCDEDLSSWRLRPVLRISADTTMGAGGKFFREFLPGLISVALGNVFLVGVQPRTPVEVAALPSDWRSLYLKTKAGLITEADVHFGPDATLDELYTGEAFYSATESTGHDLRLAFLWFWQCIGSSRATANSPVRNSAA